MLTKTGVNHWRKLENAAGRMALLQMARLVRHLPASWLPALGSAVGDLVRTISWVHRRRVNDNLQIAFGGEKTAAERRRIARAAYRNLGMNLLEFLRMPSMTPEEIDRRVIVVGGEMLDAALARGKGVVLLTAHVGNWELVGAKLALVGYPVNVIARDQADQEMAGLFRGVRESCGMRVIPSRNAVRASLRCLRRNEVLCVLGDVNGGATGVFVDFFGKLASTPTGPAALALRTGAAVVPSFCSRRPDHHHQGRVTDSLVLDSTGDLDADILRHTARLTKIIEQQIRREPEQWYWLLGRWKTRPPGEIDDGADRRQRARGNHPGAGEEPCSRASSAS